VNLRLDVQILGWLVVVIGVFQLVPVVEAWIHGDPIVPYLYSCAIALIYGLPTALGVQPEDRRMRTRDGFVVVTGGWVLASVFGALPYLLSRELGVLDSLFESASGFTTTGATVLTGLDTAPHGLLLWRALTQWLGGMGIIVFTIAVLPLLGIGGMQLFRAEVPGPVTDKLTPRIADTARRLWMVYVGFTAAAYCAYWMAGMSPFDAFCHALTTLSSGGFSTRDASMAAWSPAAQWIAVVFMITAGTNFALHYRLLAGRIGEVSRDIEFRIYLGLLIVACAAMFLVNGNHGEPTALREAVFQTVSIVTTTGYASADYEGWAPAAQFFIFHLLVVGGMAGSTSGGVKTLRLLIAARTLRAFVWRLTHPQAVRGVRHAGRPVPEDVVSGVAVFLLAYLAIAVVAGGVIAAHGYDPMTAMSAAFSAIGNVGPGLGDVGPTDTHAHFPASVKAVLTFCMLAGRLEIFTVLVILEPHFWKR
jgi:trk system potassium uptake protein TrkH